MMDQQRKLCVLYLKQDCLPKLIDDIRIPLQKLSECYISLNIVANEKGKEDEKFKIGPESLFSTLENKPAVKTVLVLGGAGSGKSSFLQNITYSWALRKLFETEFEFVFKLRLKLIDSTNAWKSGFSPIQLKNSLVCFISYCLDVDGEVQKLDDEDRISFEEVEAIFKNENNRILILLDGYDEVANLMKSSTDPVLKNLHNKIFTDKARHWLLLTSRFNALGRSEENYFKRRVECVGLGDDSVQAYIRNFYGSQQRVLCEAMGRFESTSEMLQFYGDSTEKEEQEVYQLFANLPSERCDLEAELPVLREQVVSYFATSQQLTTTMCTSNSNIRALVDTPINLTLLCLICSDHNVQERLSRDSLSFCQLYEEVVLWLSKRFCRDKRSAEEFTKEQLQQLCELQVLRHVAHDAFMKQQLSIEGAVIQNAAGEAHSSLADVNRFGLLKVEKAAAKASKQDSFSALVNNLYSFVHLSFQEYLTACQLLESLASSNCASTCQQIAEHRNEPRNLLMLKFLANLVTACDSELVVERFWEAILCNVDGVIELGLQSKVSLLMHLLAQAKVNGAVDGRIPHCRRVQLLIDVEVVCNLVAYEAALLESGYRSDSICQAIAAQLDLDYDWQVSFLGELRRCSDGRISGIADTQLRRMVFQSSSGVAQTKEACRLLGVEAPESNIIPRFRRPLFVALRVAVNDSRKTSRFEFTDRVISLLEHPDWKLAAAASKALQELIEAGTMAADEAFTDKILNRTADDAIAVSLLKAAAIRSADPLWTESWLSAKLLSRTKPVVDLPLHWFDLELLVELGKLTESPRRDEMLLQFSKLHPEMFLLPRIRQDMLEKQECIPNPQPIMANVAVHRPEEFLPLMASLKEDYRQAYFVECLCNRDISFVLSKVESGELEPDDWKLDRILGKPCKEVAELCAKLLVTHSDKSSSQHWLMRACVAEYLPEQSSPDWFDEFLQAMGDRAVHGFGSLCEILKDALTERIVAHLLRTRLWVKELRAMAVKFPELCASLLAMDGGMNEENSSLLAVSLWDTGHLQLIPPAVAARALSMRCPQYFEPRFVDSVDLPFLLRLADENPVLCEQALECAESMPCEQGARLAKAAMVLRRHPSAVAHHQRSSECFLSLPSAEALLEQDREGGTEASTHASCLGALFLLYGEGYLADCGDAELEQLASFLAQHKEKLAEFEELVAKFHRLPGALNYALRTAERRFGDVPWVAALCVVMHAELHGAGLVSQTFFEDLFGSFLQSSDALTGRMLHRCLLLNPLLLTSELVDEIPEKLRGSYPTKLCDLLVTHYLAENSAHRWSQMETLCETTPSLMLMMLSNHFPVVLSRAPHLITSEALRKIYYIRNYPSERFLATIIELNPMFLLDAEVMMFQVVHSDPEQFFRSTEGTWLQVLSEYPQHFDCWLAVLSSDIRKQLPQFLIPLIGACAAMRERSLAPLTRHPEIFSESNAALHYAVIGLVAHHDRRLFAELQWERPIQKLADVKCTEACSQLGVHMLRLCRATADTLTVEVLVAVLQEDGEVSSKALFWLLPVRFKLVEAILELRPDLKTQLLQSTQLPSLFRTTLLIRELLLLCSATAEGEGGHAEIADALKRCDDGDAAQAFKFLCRQLDPTEESTDKAFTAASVLPAGRTLIADWADNDFNDLSAVHRKLMLKLAAEDPGRYSWDGVVWLSRYYHLFDLKEVYEAVLGCKLQDDALGVAVAWDHLSEPGGHHSRVLYVAELALTQPNSVLACTNREVRLLAIQFLLSLLSRPAAPASFNIAQLLSIIAFHDEDSSELKQLIGLAKEALSAQIPAVSEDELRSLTQYFLLLRGCSAYGPPFFDKLYQSVLASRQITTVSFEYMVQMIKVGATTSFTLDGGVVFEDKQYLFGEESQLYLKRLRRVAMKQDRNLLVCQYVTNEPLFANSGAGLRVAATDEKSFSSLLNRRQLLVYGEFVASVVAVGEEKWLWLETRSEFGEHVLLRLRVSRPHEVAVLASRDVRRRQREEIFGSLEELQQKRVLALSAVVDAADQLWEIIQRATSAQLTPSDLHYLLAGEESMHGGIRELLDKPSAALKPLRPADMLDLTKAEMLELGLADLQERMGKVEGVLQNLDLDALESVTKREKLSMEAEREVAAIEADPYKVALYQTLRWQLNAVYVASSCIETDMVANQKQGVMGALGGLLNTAATFTPLIGMGVAVVGQVLQGVDAAQQQQSVENYAALAADSVEMARLAEEVSRRVGLVSSSLQIQSRRIVDADAIGAAFQLTADAANTLLQEGVKGLTAMAVKQVKQKLIASVQSNAGGIGSGLYQFLAGAGGTEPTEEEQRAALGEEHAGIVGDFLVELICSGKLSGCSDRAQKVENALLAVEGKFAPATALPATCGGISQEVRVKPSTAAVDQSGSRKSAKVHPIEGEATETAQPPSADGKKSTSKGGGGGGGCAIS